jgi:hypothetical protein
MLAGAWWLVLVSARTAPQQNDGTLRTRAALTISYTIHHPHHRQLFAGGKPSFCSANYFLYPQLHSYRAETLLETCIPVRPTFSFRSKHAKSENTRTHLGTSDNGRKWSSNTCYITCVKRYSYCSLWWPLYTWIPKLTVRQQYNNNYGGGYGQSNPYDNAPPPQYGTIDLTSLP